MEGKLSTISKKGEKQPVDENQFGMDHDAEEGISVREEGKKRQRGEYEVYVISNNSTNLAIRDRSMVSINLFISAATKR